MDDREAHFVTMVGDISSFAGLGGIEIELLTSSGRFTGIPSPQPAEGTEAAAIDETGYLRGMLIDGQSVQLDDVIELVLRKP